MPGDDFDRLRLDVARAIEGSAALTRLDISRAIAGAATLARLDISRAIAGAATLARLDVARAIEGSAALTRLDVSRAIEGSAALTRLDVSRAIEGSAALTRLDVARAIEGSAALTRLDVSRAMQDALLTYSALAARLTAPIQEQMATNQLSNAASALFNAPSFDNRAWSDALSSLRLPKTDDLSSQLETLADTAPPDEPQHDTGFIFRMSDARRVEFLLLVLQGVSMFTGYLYDAAGIDRPRGLDAATQLAFYLAAIALYLLTAPEE